VTPSTKVEADHRFAAVPDPKRARMIKARMTKTMAIGCFEISLFRALDSFRISTFGFRAFSLLSLSFLASCGESEGKVTGTVTFDGQPVASGTITFVKSEGELIREGAVIKDGSFQAHVPPGNYKIELSAQKVVGKRTQKGFDGKDEEVEETKELFPERYNIKTELTTKIDRGTNTVKLEAKSGK